MEQAAAFLETRHYAARPGATTEFTMMEGQTHNAVGQRLYTALSYVRKGMIDNKNGKRPQDDIRLTGDKKDFNCVAALRARPTCIPSGCAERSSCGGLRWVLRKSA